MADKRAEREIPREWRESVARHLAAWVAKQPKGRRTHRALAKELGVSNFTYTKLKNREGPLGLHVLVQLRTVLEKSLDDLLDLPPLGQQLSPSEIESFRALIRREEEGEDAETDAPAPDARRVRIDKRRPATPGRLP